MWLRWAHEFNFLISNLNQTFTIYSLPSNKKNEKSSNKMLKKKTVEIY